MAGRHSWDDAVKQGRVGAHVPPTPHSDPPPSDTRGRRQKNRRPGPKHYAKEDTPPPRAPRKPKAAPTSSAPTSSAPRTATQPTARVGPATRAKTLRMDRVGEEARYVAQQAAIRATTGKPTVSGRAAAGAASGAAVGSAIAPGVGTAVGGGVGAVVGGVSGASAKKAYKSAMRPYPGARRALVAEFAVCALIVALSPMTDKTERPGAWMRRMTAVMGVFFILGLVSTAGRWGARAAAGFGGVVTVALVVSERNLFHAMTGAFTTTRDGEASFGTAPGPAGSGSAEKTDGIEDMQPAGE
jgi:hypothetical protein